jgi:hypothetical protein
MFWNKLIAHKIRGMIPCYHSYPRPLFLRKDRRTTILSAELYRRGACRARGSVDGWGIPLQVGLSRVWFPIVSLDFLIDISFLPLYGSGILNLSHKWAPGICPGNKGVQCVRLTTLPSWANCLEIWEPKPPGTLSACPGLYRDCFLARCQNVGEL